MALSQDAQVHRFCRQYLQLESHLDYPDPDLLKRPETQYAIYEKLFSACSVASDRRPPARYQVRCLKELLARIEASIDDWEEYVSLSRYRVKGYCKSPTITRHDLG